MAFAAVAMPAYAQAVAAQDQPSQAATGQEADDAQGQTGGNEVVVTGRRAALMAADERKRKSETIIDSVVADEAGKLPDKSITEVLQRVSGVSIVRFRALNDPDHFSVEGTGVQVRGLTGVASRLNGRDIFSANNGRALLWGDVTPEMMAAVDVYKDSTADLIEGGTGGQIDLRTRKPFDYGGGLHVAATGDLSRGDLSKKKDPSVSALITDRWSTPLGEIGILADLAYSQLSTTSQFFRMESYQKKLIGTQDYYIPVGYDYGEEKFRRRRTGIYGALQWKPADSLLITGTFFQSQYKNASGDWGGFIGGGQMVVDPAQSKFDSSGGLISSPAIFLRNSSDFSPSGAAIGSGGNKGFQRGSDKTRDVALSFNWNPAQSHFSAEGGIQRVNSTSVVNRMDVFRGINFPSSFSFDLSGSLPKITLPAGTSAALANPANYLWQAAMPHNNNSKGRLDSANLDLEYKFDDGFFKSVKVGGRTAKRTERDLDNGYAWAALGSVWNGAPQLTFANAAAGDVEAHTFNNFFHGDFSPPEGTLLFPSQQLVEGLIYPSAVAQIFAAPPAGFCGPATDANGATPPLYANCSPSGPLPKTGYGGAPGRTPGFILPGDLTRDKTTDNAVYGLIRFGQDGGLNFAGNVGLRVVWLKNQSTGYFQQTTAQSFIRNGQTMQLAQTAEVVSGGASFTRFLPNINLQIGPSQTTKVRFAYNRTMDLPSFYALRASGTLGIQTTPNPGGTTLPAIFSNFTTSSGNPRLKPTMSQNLDLSFEWYPKAGSSAHLALFHKRLTNLPVYAATQLPFTAKFADGTTEQVLAATTDVVNASAPATIKGFEVGGRTFFNMLPGFLRGLGVEANYTLVDSKNPGDRYTDINGAMHSNVPITGLSKHNFNVTALYELDPISLRVAYSWRSKYLQSTNANGTTPSYDYYFKPTGGASVTCTTPNNGYCTHIVGALPIYGDSYGTVDAGIRFIVNKHLSLSLDGTNLLNATQRTLMGGYVNNKKYVRSWFQSDRTISVGANVAF